MKFKSDIEVQAGIKDYSGSSGVSGQVLSSDGTTVSWIDAEIGVAGDVQNRVKAGVAINKGQAVYVTGADGTNIIVGLASNTTEATSSKTLGLLNATVSTNGFADVIQIGRLSGLNTIGAVVGDPVWLGTNGNLIYGLANKPYAPAHLVYIGVVTRVNASNGEIFVSIQNGFELKEIHDVDIVSTPPIYADVLGYNGSLWVNKTIPGWLGYTPANDANVVKLTGSQTIAGEKTFTDVIYSDNATFLKQSTAFFNQTDYTNISGHPGGIYIGTTSAASTISMTNLTAFRFYELPDASGTIALTSDITGFVPYTGATSNVNLGTRSISASNYILSGATGNTGLYYGHTNKVVLANYVVGGGIDFETNGGNVNMILDGAGDLSVVGNVTANSFIKIGGNSTQYLKADGSVSTAMNSRIEVNFIATAGQTTFVTPYEVGQIDVYYNGSKLYPNEFTATNGTDVILATGATLNVQISIVKYVSSLSTTAIRNETTFTTTAGQTTFAVNYSPGQVDVFYNGSKLNISEFTAVNGTSVVLGFACAAGESIVIDSYVNQISGASGTTDFVSKFTGPASLGNSQIFDNGVNLGIDTITPEGKLTVKGTSAQPPVSGTTANSLLQLVGSLNNQLNIGSNTVVGGYGSYIQASDNNLAASYQLNLQPNGGNVIIGGYTDNGNKLQVTGGATFGANGNLRLTSDSSNGQIVATSGKGLQFYTNDGIANPMNITSGGNVGIGNNSPYTLLDVNGSIGIANVSANTDAGSDPRRAGIGWKSNGADIVLSTLITTTNVGDWGGDLLFYTRPANSGPIPERMRITSGGETYIQAGTGYQVRIQPNCQINTTLNGGGASMYLNYQGNGAIYAGSSYAVLYAGSDRRIKTDIKDAESTLEKILNLTPRTFKYKERPNDVSYGFIAQEVEEIMPEIVKTSEGVSNCAGEEIIDQKSIESYGLAWASILVKAMQEQNVIIQELKAEIERISAKV